MMERKLKSHKMRFQVLLMEMILLNAVDEELLPELRRCVNARRFAASILPSIMK